MKRFLRQLLKRPLPLLLLLFLLPSMAFADYTLTPAPIPESVVIEKLIGLGYMEIATNRTNSILPSPEAIQAFQEDQLLEPTGEMDARTLVRLFTQTNLFTASVWIPVYGGRRYHRNDNCNGMNEPEYVSLRTAYELGFTPCRRCHP